MILSNTTHTHMKATKGKGKGGKSTKGKGGKCCRMIG